MGGLLPGVIGVMSLDREAMVYTGWGRMRFIKGFTCGWMFGELEKAVYFWLKNSFWHSTDDCVNSLSTLKKY